MQFRPSSTIENRTSKKHLIFNGFNDLNNRNQNLKIISNNLKNPSDRYKNIITENKENLNNTQKNIDINITKENQK